MIGTNVDKIAEHYIETSSGINFHFLDPQPEEIKIEDIAFALANNCRYNGHVPFYSVAEHSVYVASLLPDWLKLTGLLHDAAEAYIADMPSPIKQFLPDYEKIERKIEEAIAKKFGLVYPFPLNVKLADRQQLCAEAYHLLPSKGEHWEMWKDGKIKPTDGKVPRCVPPAVAYEVFMKAYQHLTKPIIELPTEKKIVLAS